MVKSRLYEGLLTLVLLGGCSGAEPVEETGLGTDQQEINSNSMHFVAASSCPPDEYLAGVDLANTNRIICARTTAWDTFYTNIVPVTPVNGVASCGINRVAVGWTRDAAGTITSIKCRQVAQAVTKYDSLGANTTLLSQITATSPHQTSTSHLTDTFQWLTSGGWYDELPICAARMPGTGLRPTSGQTGTPGAIIELSRKSIQGVNRFFYTCGL